MSSEVIRRAASGSTAPVADSPAALRDLQDKVDPLRVIFLIRSLDYGGAQRQLVNLARGLHQRGHGVSVITYYAGGPFWDELQALGVRLVSLDKRSRWDLIGPFRRFASLLREERPHVVHGFMPTENLWCLASARVARIDAKIVWGLRASEIDVRQYGRVMAATLVAQRALLPFANMIIANSHAGIRSVGREVDGRHVVIPNGIDTECCRPDAAARDRGRLWLGAESAAPLVLSVGRLDPMKGHDVFLRAAALVSEKCPGARYFVVGAGPAGYQRELEALAAGLGIADRVGWRAPTEDVRALYNAADVVVSSSRYGEGFSNVLAEAMACGAPVVATRVGDSERVLGAFGQLVELGDPRALADGVVRALAEPRGEFGPMRRRWIAENFSVERLARATELHLARVVSAGLRKRAN